MAQAVAHFLFGAFLVSLFRDKILKKRRKRHFPLHYVLIAGLGAVLPDIDIVFYYFLSLFGYTFNQVHRSFTHSIFFPLCFLFLGLIFHATKNKSLGKHKLKLSTIFYVLSFGILTHLILDAVFDGSIRLLFPFSDFSVGLNIISYLPQAMQSSAPAMFDGLLLIVWIEYLEWKHKISDFI